MDPSMVGVEPIAVIIVSLIGALTTVFVALMQLRMRQDMRTNHGSKNIGDAIDRITDKLTTILQHQQDLGWRVEAIERRHHLLDAAARARVEDERIRKHGDNL